MTNVATISTHLSSVRAPDQLAALPAWLVWRYEHHDGEAKPRKVPYWAGGGRRHGVQGRPEDRAQLVTFEAARTAAARRGFDGVGFAPLPDFGIVALDFDHCKEHLQEIEALVATTYAEFSPSGEGVRAFFRGELGNNKAHGEPFGFETFSSKGFVTFTGNRLDITDLMGSENTIAPVTEPVRALCARRFGRVGTEPVDPLMAYEPKIGLSLQQIAEALDVLPDDLPYEATKGASWLSVGMAIHHETEGSEEGFALWDEWSAKSPKYTTQEYGRAKWDSFGKAGQRPTTARSLVKWANEHGARLDPTQASASDFEDVSTEQPLRFPVIPAGEFSRGQRPDWIIKHVLPRAELAVLFGESGSGKSFVALDMAMAIAQGKEWRGRKVRKGRVVYIAAEGGGGFRNRITAYEMHHGLDADLLDFGIIHAAPNFLQKADALDVAKAIVAFGKADVIVVDTFAQVTPGANENAAEDIGKALAHCRGLHRATGALVVLVHHAGKDTSKGARGWSGLRAAADAEIEIVRTLAGRGIRISKQKDGDDQGSWGFELHPVQIGIDEDGDVIDSCVVVEAAMPEVSKVGDRRKPMGVWERLVGEVIAEFSLGQSAGIEVESVVEEVARRGPTPEDGQRDRRKFKAKRALIAMSQEEGATFLIEGDCIQTA